MEHRVAAATTVIRLVLVWCACGAQFERDGSIAQHIREGNKKNTAQSEGPK